MTGWGSTKNYMTAADGLRLAHDVVIFLRMRMDDYGYESKGGVGQHYAQRVLGLAEKSVDHLWCHPKAGCAQNDEQNLLDSEGIGEPSPGPSPEGEEA